MTSVSFDPFLFRAVREVARGEIGTTTVTGELRHRAEEPPLHVFSALYALIGHRARGRPAAQRASGWVRAAAPKAPGLAATKIGCDQHNGDRRRASGMGSMVVPPVEAAEVGLDDRDESRLCSAAAGGAGSAPAGDRRPR